tara:strand:- start:818 stop:1897 length:1080 start_codon:yes stop_codon:yes gene_type:complete
MIVIDCRCLQDDSKFRGIGNVIRSLITHLPNKHQYRLLSEKGCGTFECYGIELLEFQIPSNQNHYSKCLCDFLKAHHIKHCHFMAQYNIPANFNFPFSVTVHDLFNDSLLTNQKRYQQKLTPLLSNLHKAKHIIAISNYTKSTIIKQLPHSSVSVIYNGFNSSMATHANMPFDLSKPFNIKKPYILYVGNYEKRKNFLGALRGFIEFNKHSPHYQLVACTGHQPLIVPPPILWLRIKHYQKINLLSYLPSNTLATLYNHAAALLFMSYAEGFGLPVLEAMAVQTPAVISNRTSLPEVGQDAAMYADPDKPHDIAAALIKITTDQACRSSIIENMPKVLTQFDSKKQAALYDQLLTTLVQ